MIGEGKLLTVTPISLNEMSTIRLMNRVDSKYLTDRDTWESVLETLAGNGFFVFEIEGHRLCSYDSLYFDTPDYRMYLAHHNGRLTRQKVRTRVYRDTNEAFLEIKLKNNHGRTRKKRVGISEACFEDFSAQPDAAALIRKHSSIGIGEFSPSVETAFHRITLVDPLCTERITVDTDVHFVNRRNGNAADMGDAVIIEIKQDGHKRSRMREVLLEHRVKPFRISKYCMGVAMTEPSVKHNRFICKMRAIEKINKLKK